MKVILVYLNLIDFLSIVFGKSTWKKQNFRKILMFAFLPSLFFNFPHWAVLLLLLWVFSGFFLKKFLFKQILWTFLMVRISINSKSPSEEDVVKAVSVYYVYCLFIFTNSLCIFSLLKTHTRIYLLNKQSLLSQSYIYSEQSKTFKVGSTCMEWTTIWDTKTGDNGLKLCPIQKLLKKKKLIN